MIQGYADDGQFRGGAVVVYGKGKNFFKDVIFEDNGSGVLGKPGIGGGADEKIHVFFQCG